jgi:hypothetical protein
MKTAVLGNMASGGGPGGSSLAIIAAYGPDEFRKLMRTGAPIGGREP